MNIYLFDPSERFIEVVKVRKQHLADSAGVGLLSGVPDGNYTVVSFANAEQTELTDLVPGESTLPELIARLQRIGTCRSADKLFHSMDRYHVRRGWPVVQSIDLNKLFYQIDLTVTGVNYLNIQPADFTVHFVGTAAGVQYDGQPISEKTDVQPYLLRMPDNRLLSMFNTLPFEKYNNPVHLILNAAGETIADIPLSDYLAQNDVGIDFHNDKDIVIPIDIEITSVGITVTINDWDEGAIQIPNLGN